MSLFAIRKDYKEKDSIRIKVLLSGGTLDKEYDEHQQKLVFKGSTVPRMLRIARCSVGSEVDKVMLKDSLDMDMDDRKIILKHCIEASEDRIVITHGTDTLVETAEVIGKKGLEKTIVLIGAMVPYVFGNSDALFNLGAAVSAVQLLPEGTYIIMNGQIFSWDNVKKDKETGVFEEKG